MKKVLGIGLLFCLFLPLLTTYTWLSAEKHQLKRQLKWRMIAGLEKKELCHLNFSVAHSKEALRWEHAKEFEYAGKMYDIVERLERSDSVFYLCWLDDDETLLNKKLQAILQNAFNRSPQQKEGKARVFRFLDSLYFVGSLSYSRPQPDPKLLTVSSDPEGTYHSPVFSPPSPPPKSPFFL